MFLLLRLGVEFGGATRPLLGCRRSNAIAAHTPAAFTLIVLVVSLAKALRRHPKKLAMEGVNVPSLISVRPKLDLFATC